MLQQENKITSTYVHSCVRQTNLYKSTQNNSISINSLFFLYFMYFMNFIYLMYFIYLFYKFSSYSLLGKPRVKKGDINFDLGMGAFHRAQACEIVGLFLLNKLQEVPNFQPILYRDDGLGVTNLTPRLQEKLKQSLIRIFKEQGLNITIEINQVRVDFLDVTLDLKTGLYKPYKKPGDKPLYEEYTAGHRAEAFRQFWT